MIEFHNAPASFGPGALTRLKYEMEIWEAVLLTHRALLHAGTSLVGNPHADAMALFILSASLLLDIISEQYEGQPYESTQTSHHQPDSVSSIRAKARERQAATPRWQVDMALSMLKMSRVYESWTRCYLGSWSMLILGYSVESSGDRLVVKQVLRDVRR